MRPAAYFDPRWLAMVAWPTTTSPLISTAAWRAPVRRRDGRVRFRALVVARPPAFTLAGTGSVWYLSLTRSTWSPSRYNRIADPRTRSVARATAGSQPDRVCLRVRAEHVKRLGRRDAEAAALADREVVMAGCRPSSSRFRPRPARLVGQAAVPPQEVLLALAGEEAEVLALRASWLPTTLPARRSRGPRPWRGRPTELQPPRLPAGAASM